MARRVVEKTQVTYVLEAVKEALKHLGNWGGGELGGVPPPRQVAHQYSLLRRLREYLTRCVESYRTPIEWELSEDDENLIVSCIVHALAGLDRRLHDRNLNPKDKTWLVGKRESLIQLARSMHTRPLERIAHPHPHLMATESVFQFLERKFQGADAAEPGQAWSRVVADPARSGGVSAPGTPTPRPADRGATGIFGFEMMPAPPDWVPGEALPGPAPRAQEPKGIADVLSSFSNSTKDSSWSALRVHGPEIGDPWEPLDLSRIREPRLRSLIGLDVSAFGRAVRSDDLRLQLVHLSSILEGVILDARTRVEALSKNASADALEDLERVLGRTLSKDQGAILAQLQAARSLLRPALMLETPIAVTPDIVKRVRGFLDQVLLELGYIGALSR